ncbi:MAG: hypothetical protein IJ815_00435 [Lachnospiraceae bacterium]|nr:hypothetical protein [Lachnospiraceae bacterium]
METKQSSKQLQLFAGAFILGALLFIMCYGAGVLDVTYDDWIFHMIDPDIKQHYLGWCFYRNSPWQFPLGLMENLAYPAKMSILWTDSMPLVAMILKPFSPLLPTTFQYIGWYGLLSTALTSGIGALILYKLTRSRIVSFIASACFAVAPHMLQRMFYHTTLTAQWLILLPILWWINDVYKLDLRKKLMLWAGYSFVAVTIHPYLWAMGCFIWAFIALEELIVTHKLSACILEAVSLIAAAVFGLWIMGAFYGGVNSEYIAGGYESNLNTLINPLGKSRIFHDLPLAVGLQYEGYGYLGAGVILLVIISALALVLKKIRKNKIFTLRRSLMLLMFIFFFFFAVFPEISVNEHMIKILPQPGLIGKFFGTFRSTGRFIWPVVWLCIIGSVTVLKRSLKENAVIILVAFCMFVQLYDLSTAIADKKESLKTEKIADSDLDDPTLTACIDHYRHVVMVYDDNIDMNDLAYFAYRYGLTINRYYFARDINEQIEENLEDYRQKLTNGEDVSDCIFVMKESELANWTMFDLHFYFLNGSYIGVSEPIEGLEELYL